MSPAVWPLDRTPHSGFGTVAHVVDANHYGVASNWGPVIEASYYRATVIPGGFKVGEHVFLERLPGSQLWMITSHAYGDPLGSTNVGWAQLGNSKYGAVGGIGRIVP